MRPLPICGGLLALLPAILAGCIPHPVFTPMFGREFRPTAGERDELSRGLLVALYQREFIPPIDYGGPYPLRARVVTADSDGVYRAPIEVFQGYSGIFLWFVVHTFQHAPVFYAFVDDCRSGLLTKPAGYNAEFNVFLRSASPLRSEAAFGERDYSASWERRSADEQMAFLLLNGLLKCEPQEHAPDHPFIPPDDARAIQAFVDSRPACFSEGTRALARRLAQAVTTTPTTDEYAAWESQRELLRSAKQSPVLDTDDGESPNPGDSR